MARAPDAPQIEGGQIDPYVQQSLLQGKQQGENRLLESMQQTGATQRQAMAGQTQMASQQLAGQQAMQRQAADAAQRDKEAAQAEVSKREDRDLMRSQQEQQQKFDANMVKLKHGYDLARQEHDDKRADDLLAEIRANNAMDRDDRIHELDIQHKVSWAEMTMWGNLAEGVEKDATLSEDETDTAEAEKGKYNKQREAIDLGLKGDKRWDLHQGPFVPDVPEHREAVMAGDVFGRPTIYKTVPAKITLTQGPTNALQTQLLKNGAKFDIGDLSTSNIHRITELIASGKLTYPEIQATLATLDSGIKQAQLEAANATTDSDKKKWSQLGGDYSVWRTNLTDLVKDTKTKIVGSNNATVGSVVGRAVDSIDGMSKGSRLAERKEAMGRSFKPAYDSYMSDLKKGMAKRYIPPIPPGADAVYRRVHAERYGATPTEGETEAPKFGLERLGQFSASQIEGL